MPPWLTTESLQIRALQPNQSRNTKLTSATLRFFASPCSQVQIGEVLKESYREAKQVRLAHPLSPALVPANVENNAIAASAPNPILTTNALVYVKESPDFCVANGTIGVAGTARRRCKENSKASDGCELLCCGNGYFETRAVKREQCECKFVWCCEVKCQWCHKVYRYFHCKMPRPQVA